MVIMVENLHSLVGAYSFCDAVVLNSVMPLKSEVGIKLLSCQHVREPDLVINPH